MLSYMTDVNDSMAENSDEFFRYQTPKDFRIEHRKVELFHTGSEPPKKQPKNEWGKFLRFTSPVESPYPENNCANARWFPAKGHRAVVLLPQWNADGVSQNALCRIFNLLGIAALRLSMPYHDIRRPAGLTRADYAVSANVGRTIDATRQGIADIRSCMDWLEQRGYSRLGIVGTSLGSCYAFLASAHDARIRVNVFNHASTSFGDVTWTGQSTQHIRQGVEAVLTQEELRRVWMSHQPDCVLQQVRTLAEEVADDLRPLRSDVSAGVLSADGGRIPAPRAGHHHQGAALRTLFSGRDALQVHGRLAYLAVSGEGFRGVRTFFHHRDTHREFRNQTPWALWIDLAFFRRRTVLHREIT